MKKYLTSAKSLGIIAAIFFFPAFWEGNLFAQNIAINTSGNAAAVGAGLDVDFTNKALLIPRVSLASNADLMGNASMQTSAIVYKKDLVGWGAAIGYYYWNGAIWVPFFGAGGADWALLGNANTVDGTNFLGTTDNVPLNFRVNGTKAGRIDGTLSNAFFGFQAANSNSTGNSNVAIGTSALFNNTSGSSNVAVGASALNWNTTSSNNTAVGVQAMYGNCSGCIGSNNTAVGYLSLYAINGGSNNVGIGYYTCSGGTGNDNVAIGNTALEFVGASSHNTAVGSGSMWSATNGGGDNTTVGYGALPTVTNGATRNTAVGSQINGSASIRGNDNVLLGYQASYGIGFGLTGSKNIIIGSSASYNQRDESDNIAIGYQSLYSSSYNNGGTAASFYNVAIGNGALYSNNSTGLPSAQDALDNTAIGHNVLYSNTHGSYNTASGYQAGYYNQTGNGNTLSGYQAGYGVTTNSYSNNTAHGYKAMGVVSTGSNNIAIGYQAGNAGASNLTTGSNNIIIGYNIDAPVGTSSNQLAIGNMIFATGVNGTGTTISTGNVGIATNAPSERLHVLQSQNGKSRVYLQNATAGTSAAAEFFVRRADNKVVSMGIGDPTYNVTAFPADFRGMYLYTDAPAGIALRSDDVAGPIRFVANGTGTPSEYMRVTPNGNVGIGTSTPARKFDIHGGAFAAYAMFHTNFSGNTAADGLELSMGVANDAYLWNYENNFIQFGTNATARMIILGNGNIGIGQAIIAPGELLEVGAADATIRVRNTNDAGGGFVGNTWSALQLGIYNPSGGAFGVVAAGVKRSFFGFDNNGVVGSLTNNYGSPVFRNKLDDGAGNMCYTGTLAACSDVRYKKDITPLPNALDHVLKLQGVNYFWKTKEFPEKMFTDKKQIGFIAQEIEKIYPELVLTDESGYKSVDYSRLTPILVEAMKEQQAMIEKLRSEKSEQQNQMDAQNARLEKLESLLNVAKK